MFIPRPRSVLAFFLSFGSFLVSAQSCSFTLKGTVIDEHDRTPLPFAEVFLLEVAKGAVADEQGRYTVAGLCAGPYTMRITHLGCEPVVRQVDVRSDLELDVRLEHHAHELQEFEVARNRPDENVGQASDAIDKEAIERAAGLTLGEMLATFPGVTVLASGPTIAKPVIHGLSGSRILVLNQGIRQEDQQWGSEHAPSLDPLTSERITVVKGAAAVQYGSDALGGVVITEPVELPRDTGMQGEVRAQGVLNGRGGGGHGMLQGGVKGLKGSGWRVQGSGRYLGDSRSSRYVLSNTGVRELGASAALGYRDHRWIATAYYSYFARELGILRTSHIGNLTDLNAAIASSEPWYVSDPTYGIASPRQEVQHHMAKAEVGYAVSDRGRVQVTYGYQADDRQEYDIRRGGRSNIPALDLFLITHTGEAVWKHWLGQRLHGKAGVNGLHQENFNRPGTGVSPLIPNYRKQSAGVFVLEHLPLSEQWELEFGARWESTLLHVAKYDLSGILINPEHTFRNHAFSMGANWALNDSLRIRFNINSAYRPPHVSELYSEGLHHGAAAIETGDEHLGSEGSWKAVLELEGSSGEGRSTFQVTTYADRIHDFIYLLPVGQQLTVRGAFPVFQYTATNAWLLGLDARFGQRIARDWVWELRASTVRARDIEKDEWLFQMPSDRLENMVLFEFPSQGRWSAMEAGLTSTLVFQQRRIPAGVDFASPPATYHLVGCQVSAARTSGRRQWRVGLRGANLFNTAYRDYLDRFRYYADARGIDLTIWVSCTFGAPRTE
ncbi:MAG: TonB-dependent receptor [Flavobacteriales bacterium]|nr:TonB-dependent receptor [Flavobacteriales bacterium]